MHRIAITGGSGFIGSNFVNYCCTHGYDVMSLDIRPPEMAEQREVWLHADILDLHSLEQELIAFRPDVIVHLAARTDIWGSCMDDYLANTIGVRNMISAAKAASVSTVIFVSSQLVCSLGYIPQSMDDCCPPNVYGQSKVIGERIVRDEAQGHFQWIIVRPTSIWGPGYGANHYLSFFRAVKRGVYIHPRQRKITKSFGYVGNTVFQLARLAESLPTDLDSQTIYLADYQPLELRYWAEMIRQELDAPKILDLPLGCLRGAALVGDVLQRFGKVDLPLTSYRLSNLLTSFIHDIQPIQQVCPELPYSLLEGVQQTVSWMIVNGY